MKLTRTFIFLVFTIILISCDFVDDKLVFKNNSPQNVIVETKFYFSDTDSKGEVLTSNFISSNTTKTLELLNRHWSTYFTDSEIRGKLEIIVVEADTIDPHSHYYGFLDSKIAQKAYRFKRFSLEELNKKEWRVLYPSDEFKIPN